MKGVEEPPHVAHEGEDVDDQDHVEWPPGLGQGWDLARVALEEVQVGMAGPGRRHRLAGEVDAHPERGGTGGEQVAHAAADLEHALAGGDAGLQDAGEVVVVVVPLLPRPCQLGMVGLVEVSDLVPGVFR